ncbi:DUF6017 domain-containing protein [Pseudobacteroides cellulosolvens]|uniref:DUF6017 domain-containing protein n=1 Tax=Pseudobacteroides cellulosolvens ATCC 35603 = DSM 2933 TaxID=398512 RepID=A0A0L6JP66_9FIRM|nr:DUF6017 domain-containing protein [Pseudobacteroides cellulosolvens]KNY27574.1 hypothetical protein Bccel_2845 [Pseudobacteroides cellulosolvens ATCC 35603 = DSM 2933]
MNYFSDTSISWRAKGILCYFLSDKNRKLKPKDIEEISKEGRDAVYSAINELLDNGYIQRVEIREKGRFIAVEYKVNDLKIPYTEIKEMDKINQSVSQHSVIPENKEYSEIERYFKELIKYDQMVLVYKEKDIELLDEIVLNIMDMYYSEYTTVNRDRKPQAIIRPVLSKLDPGKVTYILEQYKSVTTEIKNVKGYLQTVIYNSVFEEKSKYENWKKIIYGD